MKTERSLSGIYVRYEEYETKRIKTKCFEDMEEKDQDEYLLRKSAKFLRGMAKGLSNVINEIGNDLDLEIK